MALAIVGPTASAMAANLTATRTAHGLSAKNDSVFPSTILEGGIELGRTRVVWSSARESGRTESYAVTYAFGNQVQGVKAPPKIRALYFDRTTGTNLLATLSFIRQMTEAADPATETERFFHVSTDATSYPLFAGARLSFSAKAPSIIGAGVCDALLASMYYDPAVYSIVASAWDGPETDNDGEYGRWAVYTLRRTTTNSSAIYGASVSLPDARVYDGVAYYSADPKVVAAAHETSQSLDVTITTPAHASQKHKPGESPRPIWPYVAAAAAAAASSGLVVFWYRRRKKRAADEDVDEPEFSADEYHDPNVTDKL